MWVLIQSLSNYEMRAAEKGHLHRVGYRLNFIDFDSDSAYRFRFFSIPSFDSNVIK